MAIIENSTDQPSSAGALGELEVGGASPNGQVGGTLDASEAIVAPTRPESPQVEGAEAGKVTGPTTPAIPTEALAAAKTAGDKDGANDLAEAPEGTPPGVGLADEVTGKFSVYRLPRKQVFAESVGFSPFSTPSDEKLTLQSSIESTVTTLQSIFPPSQNGQKEKAKLSSYIDRLVMIGKLGLETDGSTKAATSALVSFQRDVTFLEAPLVKNRYMIRLGKVSIIFSIASIIAFVIMRKFVPSDVLPFVVANANFSLVWFGAMIGAWLSFGIRNVQLEFVNLGRLEADLMSPPVRLSFAGLLSIILSLILVLKVVHFTMGSLDTSKILESNLVALVVGLFCGIGEQVLPTTIGRRASDFLGQAEVKDPGGSK
jgi:hypothetical protein